MGKRSSKMSLGGHVEELRRRIFYIVAVFIVFFILGFFITGDAIDYFKASPAMEGIDWHVFKLSDAIMVYMKIAFVVSLAVTVPFTLFQVWKFVAPGLNEKERRSTIWFIPIAFFLFVLGVAFAFFIVFPMIIGFLLNITDLLQAEETFGISEYFSFMFNLLIPFGILTELPLVVVFLTKLGILNPKLLVRVRKFVYLLLVVLGASITPPDLVSELIVILPLIGLYEISIWLSRLFSIKRKEKQEAIYEEMEREDSERRKKEKAKKLRKAKQKKQVKIEDEKKKVKKTESNKNSGYKTGNERLEEEKRKFKEAQSKRNSVYNLEGNKPKEKIEKESKEDAEVEKDQQDDKD